LRDPSGKQHRYYTFRFRHRLLAIRRTVAAIALGVVVHGTQARAITLAAGQTLRVTFTESGPESVLGGFVTGAGGRAVDTLGFGETDNLIGTASGVAKLYNGAALLGSVNFTAGGFQVFSFAAPGSQFHYRSYRHCQ
jgi:hypothetical protein